MRLYLVLVIFVLAAGCGGAANNSAVNQNNVNKKTHEPLPISTYEIVKTYPHDPNAFTQGLVYRDGFLYESTGEEGESTLRKVELETGKVLQKYPLPRDVFAEGIAIMGDNVYQLSWRNRTGWVYNLSDFKLLREFRYAGEGWGLTNDASNLFLSDGTHIIRVLDPESLQTVRTIVVKDDSGRPLMKLNELEYVNGEIWSNVWHSEEIGKPNYIARIDPNSGSLLGWINLGNISPDDQSGPEKSENTLNGIAFDAAANRIFVTGKNWKKLFEIKLKPK
ncbi:MAG: glutaminyl-peptide cyclotransferase [Acidobacteriota bacterium]